MTDPNSGQDSEGTLAAALLPSFVTQRGDGLYLDLTAIDSRELIQRFVDRVFSTGAFFRDTEYDTLQRLMRITSAAELADWVDDCESAGKKAEVRLAADLLPFAAERQALYRGFNVDPRGEDAVYLFEPLLIELPDPDFFADPDNPDAEVPTIQQQEHLDADEFIAQAWTRGVRCGLDLPLIRSAIASERTQRLTVARTLPAEPGTDATLHEESKAMHRDDTPRILPDGRIDLRHFKNRFPQVAADTILLKKIPRQLGKPGWTIAGKMLESPLPQDFAIEKVAGPGTRVERNADGEFLVSALDGFISIDDKTQQVSVTEKIINREGVSARTTGNLHLQGETFEQHGEVQEKREVRGHHMTFFAAVYGIIHSDGGDVVFKDALSGATVNNSGGTVVTEASVSQALIIAPGATVTIASAENSLIVGDTVHIEHAINCDICARSLDVETVDAGTIATRSARVGTLRSRRSQPATLLLLTPDLTTWAEKIATIQERRDELLARIAQIDARLHTQTEDEELRRWMQIGRKIKSGELKLNPQQQEGWQRLQQQVGPKLKVLEQLRQLKTNVTAEVGTLAARQAAVEEARSQALADIHCSIELIEGDAQVRTLPRAANEPQLAWMAPRELRQIMHQAMAVGECLAGEGDVDFTWNLASTLANPDADPPAAQAPT